MTKLNKLLGFAGILMLAGCMSAGQQFPTTRVAEIEVGVTSQKDLLAMFGRPWRMGVEDGRNTWTYGHYRYSLFGQNQAQDLLIRFDNNGLVRSYSFNSSQ